VLAETISLISGISSRGPPASRRAPSTHRKHRWGRRVESRRV